MTLSDNQIEALGCALAARGRAPNRGNELDGKDRFDLTTEDRAKFVAVLLMQFPWLASPNDEDVEGSSTIETLSELYTELGGTSVEDDPDDDEDDDGDDENGHSEEFDPE